MNCADARHLIHLDVGDDLRTDEEQQLTSHMAHCAECRVYHSGMTSAMRALLSLRGTSSAGSLHEPAGFSFWPSISREMFRRRTTPGASRKFNLQVAALSVCSLALAVVTIVQSLASMRDSSDTTGFISSQTVSNPKNSPQFPFNQQRPADRSRPDFPPAFPPALPDSGPQSF